MRPPKHHKLSPTNRVLMFMIWTRCYPTFAVIVNMFNVSTAIVGIRYMINLFYEKLKNYLTWPTA